MKYFVTVSKTYPAKNKLHRQIIAQLKPLDCTIHPDHSAAKKAIKYAYKAGIENYTGTAKEPYPSFYNKDLGYSVPGVAILNLYPVKNA